MLFGRRFGVVGRGIWACLAVAGILFAGPWVAGVRAETSDAMVQRVRNILRQHPLKKVILTVRQDDQSQADDETRADVAALERRLEAVCRQLSIDPIAAEADGGLDEFSLTRLPDFDDVKKALADNKADAVLAVSWKATKSGVVLRVALLDDRKVLWNNRATLTRAPAKSQLASKSKGSTATAANAKTGTTPSYGTNSNPGAASTLGLNSLAGGLGGLAGAGKVAGVTDGSAGSNGGVTAFNEKILEFAISKLGTQVGNGECWTLAAEALKYAGAKPPKGYDFGAEVALDQLKPGDILHFENAVFVTTGYILRAGEPHHVAIVGEVSGTSVLIYHQNVGGDRTVQTTTIDLATLSSGIVEGYRAEAGEGSGSDKSCKKESGKGGETTAKQKK